MLKDFVKPAEPGEEALKKELKEAQEKLASYQMEIKNAKLPVIVIFEGWGAAGKGSVIGRVIKSIDPRFFRVRTMASPTEEEKRYPFLHRYLLEIPEAGKFTFFDTYWIAARGLPRCASRQGAKPSSFREGAGKYIWSSCGRYPRHPQGPLWDTVSLQQVWPARRIGLLPEPLSVQSPEPVLRLRRLFPIRCPKVSPRSSSRRREVSVRVPGSCF